MLLVFDLDGTLIDSRAFIVESARRTFSGADTPPYPGDAAFLATIGLPPEQMMERLFPELPPTEHRRLGARNIEQVWALRRERAGFEPPYAGAGAMLAAASATGATLGIATGRKRIGVDHMLGQTGWHTLFATVQAADTAPGKPDPAMLLNAMAETGHPAEITVMIGDTVHDMAMARAAGVTAIGVAWGYNPPDALHAAGAHHLVADMAALQDLLTTLPRP